MFPKLPTVLPIAILLGAVSVAPALAKTRNHQLSPRQNQVTVFPNAGTAYALFPNVGAAYRFAPSATPNFLICPPTEGYPDCHPD
jgi:hypothetical protein